jgi:hypothetical protein
MAPERDRPDLDHVREALRRHDEAQRDDEQGYEPDGSGPAPERVTEQQDRLREPGRPPA